MHKRKKGGAVEVSTNVSELKAECARYGLTLENLASQIGVNPATLHRKLAGETEFKRNELKILKCVLHLDDVRFMDIFFNN